ncbi:U3 small nucleolar RNA-associated protein 6-domain-containing protein [Lactifluus subvellereus]|nr:U3 small nucleolar RNA-associated protein 6-domain-containing protein [Lactifluus subvellereus]
MERVQFQQEQMLAELKDLGEKGLFSASEIKHIIKKRTAFETALVRRIPNKNDYLRYAAYEMGLEALRRKRVARLKLPKSAPSISDHALTRRQFHIFERALQKFKSDVPLWLQYLRVAQRAGARALAGRIAARAVQLHPRTPALYVLAAAHELAHSGMGAARVLLQRGLRLNAGAAEMWREYVRLELGFVEAVRRRWDVLGIAVDEDEKDGSVVGGEGRGKGGERVDRAEEEAMGDAARRAVMDGAIVRHAIDAAAKALPTIELFRGLQTLIAGYPAPGSLRRSLLDHLDVRLAESLPGDAAGVVLRATRGLALAPAEEEEFAGGSTLVDALRRANEEMLAALRADTMTERRWPPRDAMAGAYAQFVEEWCGKEDLDAHLKLYLVGSLHALIKRQTETPSAILLAAHVRLLLALAHLPAPPAPPSRILRIARRYTSTTTITITTTITPTTPPGAKDLWLARLHAESAHGTADSVAEACTRARRALPTCAEIWLWGADHSSSSSSSWEEFERLLAESMRDAALRDVHQSLLLRVAESMCRGAGGSDGLAAGTTVERRARVEHMARRCLPSARVWARTFAVLASPKTEAGTAAEAEEEEEEALLREVYEYWRGTGDVEEATLAWAQWLLHARKRGEEAMRVISRARHHGAGGAAVAQRWAEIVRQQEEAERQEDKGNDDTGSAESAAAAAAVEEAGDSGSKEMSHVAP